MEFLKVANLWELSFMIPKPGSTKTPSPTWVQVYREMVEWAVLFSLVKDREFGTDTIVVCDGWLRSKVFAKDHFSKLVQGLDAAIKEQYHKTKRRLYVAGVYK